MKKLIAILTLLLTLSVVGTTHAQQPDVARANKGQKFSEVVDRIIDKVTTRFERYDKFINKLETRRAKLSQEGKDVAELDNAIRLAKMELGNVRGAINTAQTNVEALDFSQEPRVVRQAVLDELKTVRESFRKLHDTVVKAVREAARLNNSN